MNELRLKTRSNEVDDSGIVTVAVAAFGNTDSQNDISEKGSFTKTLKENRKRFKHFLNHNQDFLVGCPLDAWEDAQHLVFKSEINLDTELGRDVFSNYKLYHKNGLTLEHSIGVEDVKRDPFDRRKVLEWRLWEFSTLYSWGANERTPLLDLKALQFDRSPETAIGFLKDALRLKFSDSKLRQYEQYLHLVEKAVLGETRMADCECGFKFDYDSLPEMSVEKQVLEAAREMIRWRASAAVEREVMEMEPMIRDQVAEILSKGRSLDDMTAYVLCPRCGRRIYRGDVLNGTSAAVRKSGKPSAKDTSHGTGSHPHGTLSLSAIGGLIGRMDG